MRTLKSWSKRLAFVFGAKATRQDFAAELDSHLEMSIEDNLGAGMSPEEARRSQYPEDVFSIEGVFGDEEAPLCRCR